MISRIHRHTFTQAVLKRAERTQRRLPNFIVQQRTLSAAIIACLLAILYWGFIASDRYVSEARVIIQRTDLAGSQSIDFGSLLTGSAGGNHADQLLLRDHLLSVDMLNKLDSRLNLRAHYSDRERDPLSRMWSKDTPQEWFHHHYLSRVSIELDDYAGVLVIKAQGYDPQTAHAITSMLVEEGERKMNAMAHQLAQEQVSFVEKQVAQIAERFQQARRDLISYQNKKGMVSPQSTAENLVGTINRLEAQRTEFQTRRSSLLGYLAPKAPGVVELDLQLAAIEKQIAQEQGRLAAPSGKTLNSTVEEYQRLEMAERFAQDVYKTALVALEKGRVEATRTIKKVSVLQRPTLPQYPLEPNRYYNIIVFTLVTLLLAGIVHLLAAIVRDHKD
jgi:capsular polysaccharide transport system permease protein